ncbi:Protein kinase domain-containing protein [Georgenia satyanarayanai]|uniref:non-specific serine/threonine protein kinase n=1 Tax=Georgenia satyanarayanai TaxID=860221 RepID=A0A2Y9AJU7_9MICO|nr:class III lanthionine synthetase LanKC [Georgenia satyanarayanai]PYF98933.1 protein kinase-like protein [Georgenia satyanarayanai]SSA44781.1 Protein kinase domain-containing protein [Georgenia satyanarayanai]
MNTQYQFFCPAGTPYYDVVRVDDDSHFDVAVPDGWTRATNEEWTVLTVPDRTLPEQGWKIHVSATPDSAERVLETVAGYCADHEVAFKHLRGPRMLFFRNSKYGDRGSSGKFITIFPAGTAELERVLTELGELLDGEEGPYVLSDLRWRRGPLYVRYGGFSHISGPGPDGRMVPCLRRPDGTLEPDVRKPGFRVPPWVELPEILEEAVAARGAGTLSDFPFRPEAALHFSNGGGVYRAVDTRDGSPVLLKEGRPLAGLDEAGADGVTRLERERWALEVLADVPAIPRLVDYRRGHEHYFLAREFVDGVTLAQALRERNPALSGAVPEPGDHDRYTEWALRVLADIDTSLRAMHERGVVFGDLHPNNVMVTADDRVFFIDLETATDDVENFSPRIGAPGFRAPATVRGTAVDRYALACTRLSVFLPMTVVLPWQEGKAEQLIDAVRARFPVPSSFVASVRSDLAAAAGSAAHPGETVTLDGHDDAEARVLAGVLGPVTPEREDRLFPGDIGQFTVGSGGTTFAHGATGVLWGLQQLGVEVPEEHVQWLFDGLDRTRGLGPGFATGLAGVVHTLDALGRPEDAAHVAAHLTALPLVGLGPSIADGAAGIGLLLLDRYSGGADASGLDRALALADKLAADVTAAPEPHPRTGLWYGWTGAALLALRLFEHTAEERHLGLARQALRRDLAVLRWGEASEQRWRLHTALGSGSGGVALVLRELGRHVDEPWVADAARDLTAAAERAVLGSAGWLHGQAGALLTLVHAGRAADDPAVRAHLGLLDLYAVGDADQVSFLGQEQLRLSTDLTTGSVGVALALRAARTGEPLGVPFLGSNARQPAAAGRGALGAVR